MRRVAIVAAALAGLTACGDNGPACGHVELLVGDRNIWSPMFAVDDRFIYYADYDIDGDGTALVIRGSREGGGLQALGQLAYGETFGNGLAYDDLNVYWTGSTDEQSYFRLLVSPRAGGSAFPVLDLSCVPFGVTASASNVYVGMAACGTHTSRVIALSTGQPAWTAGANDGDVRALATSGDTLFIGTSIALFAVRPSGTDVITAGNPIRHLEVHDDQLYYGMEHDGIYRTPVGGGPRERLYAYDPEGERQGAFSVEGDDLYVAEPPHMLFVPLGSRTPQILVNDLGSVSEIVARDGHAYWSALVFPNSPGGLDTFSGAIARVARPCD
jgi:hypothetical protein